jgi:RNA polymerase sigma-70 factor, ECF subfamily
MVTNSVVTHNLKKVVQCTPIEVELMQKLRKGDQEALKTIFNSNFEKLYAFVFYEVGQNRSVAEDIVQETFFSAIKSASKFKGTSQIYTWLAGIAHHKIADYYRHVNSDKNIAEIFDREQINFVVDSAPGTDIASSTENKIMIDQALNSLPSDYRKIIILKYVQELPISEIVKVLNRSPKSVEGILSRARKTLRELIV